MKKKKRYFPNNWLEYKESPDNMFHEHTFEELMSWKMAGYEIPSSICCIIRTTDLDTKRTKEFVYSKQGFAKKKIMQLIDSGENLEITVVDHESIHHLLPEDLINEQYEQ